MDTRPCKFHLRGKCWFGDKCRYPHPNLKLIKCKRYLEQKCNLSKPCPYSHDGGFDTSIVCFEKYDQHGCLQHSISTGDGISFFDVSRFDGSRLDRSYGVYLDKHFNVTVFHENPYGNSFQVYGGDFKDVHVNFDNIMKCLYSWKNLRMYLCVEIVHIIVRILHLQTVNLPVIQYGRMINHRTGEIVRDMNVTPPIY